MTSKIARTVGLWLVALAALTVTGGLLFLSDRIVREGNPLPAREEQIQVKPIGQSVLAAVGDIACEPGEKVTEATCQMQATTDLVSARNVDGVLLLGDLQYDDGTLAKFQQSFDKSWGKIQASSYPTAGNHEYGTVGAKGYFDYFGSRAGEPGKGYYSFDMNGWHLIALNSNCGAVGGCTENSPQGTWLKQDLAAHPAQCTLAFWHHPRFSSGRYHPGEASVRSFWDILYENNADVILNGHDHLYERFAPMNPVGQSDSEKGIRQFTVGTGGRSHYQFTTVLPNSEARNDDTFGVLLLTLRDGAYDWEFVSVQGKTFSDSGQGTCH